MIRATITGTLSSLALCAQLLLLPLGAAADGHVLASGTFKGASRHVTTGGVSVVKDGGKVSVVLGPDFSFDGAPDPKVGFGTNGRYDSGAQLAHLASNSGKQSYAVPASVDVSKYNEVYIWCEKYSVPLGVAKLR